MPYSTRHKGLLGRLAGALGYADFSDLPRGISFSGTKHQTLDVRLLTDLTWLDEEGRRHLEHQIFDELLALIDGARRLILLDLFLFNDLLMRETAAVRPLASELTEALVRKRRQEPEVRIIFITDPCNTAWGGIRSAYLEALDGAGVELVVTDLLRLRDSSPVYSFFWRALVRPLGNRVGGFLPNPFGTGRITLRSLLNIPNMKANHRKTALADEGDNWRGLVTSMNPHDASYAHQNVAVSFTGAAVTDLLLSEAAVMEMSGTSPPDIQIESPREPDSGTTVQILTEGKIRGVVLAEIRRAAAGDTLSLILFYLAEREVVAALAEAAERGVKVSIILDPSKDAFGWRKSGIPNRPVAHHLTGRGVDIRWANTHGEQCHSKLLFADFQGGESTLLCGSANFTRRNLNDFNLETDVCVRGHSNKAVFREARQMFDLLWNNRDGRQFTVDYSHYEDRHRYQHALYWLMETTGISTF